MQKATAWIDRQKPPFIAAGNERRHDLAADLRTPFGSPNDGDTPGVQKIVWKQGVSPSCGIAVSS
jgi:hypothetical protein